MYDLDYYLCLCLCPDYFSQKTTLPYMGVAYYGRIMSIMNIYLCLSLSVFLVGLSQGSTDCPYQDINEILCPLDDNGPICDK